MTKHQNITMSLDRGGFYTRRSVLAGITTGAMTLAGGSLYAAEISDQVGRLRFAWGDPSIGVTVAPYSSIPERLGFFKNAGIKFTLVAFKDAASAFQTMVNSQTEMMSGSILAAYPFLSNLTGDVKIISTYNSIYQLAVPDDSTIRTVRDLKGHTIGVLTLTAGSYLLARAVVKASGLDPDSDVRWLPVGVGDQAAAAYSKGQIQAFGTWDTVENVVIRQILNKKVRVLASPLNGIPGGSGFVVRTKYLEANYNLLVKYLRAIYMAEEWTLSHSREGVLIHWDKFPVAKPGASRNYDQVLAAQTEVLKARMELLRPKEPAALWGTPPIAALQKSMDIFYKNGVMKKPLEIAAFMDQRASKEANQFDRTDARNAVPIPRLTSA